MNTTNIIKHSHQGINPDTIQKNSGIPTQVLKVLEADEIISSSDQLLSIMEEGDITDVKDALNKIFEIIQSANRGDIQMYFIGLRSILEKRFSIGTLTAEDRQLLQGELDYIAGALSGE